MFFHSVALFPASKKNLKETDYLESKKLSIFARLWQQYWDAVIDALALMYYLLYPLAPNPSLNDISRHIDWFYAQCTKEQMTTSFF